MKERKIDRNGENENPRTQERGEIRGAARKIGPERRKRKTWGNGYGLQNGRDSGMILLPPK